MFVNTNVAALNAWLNLDNTQQNMTGVLQQLSSGYRINSAANDPSGLAISQQMQSQVDGMTQAYQNAQSGVTLLQTADGAMGQVQNILQSMYSLASEAATGTNNSTDLSALQSEMNQYSQEITQIANTTQFNNINLLDGTFNSKQVQIGANYGQALTMTVGAVDSYTLGVAGETVSASTGSANNALGIVDTLSTATLAPSSSGLSAATGSSYDYVMFSSTPWQISEATTTSALTFASATGAYSATQAETISLSYAAGASGAGTVSYTVTFASGSTYTNSVSISTPTTATSFTISDGNGGSFSLTAAAAFGASTTLTNTLTISPQATTFYVTNSAAAATGSSALNASDTLLTSTTTYYGAIASGTFVNLANSTTNATAGMVFQAAAGPTTTYDTAAALAFTAGVTTVGAGPASNYAKSAAGTAFFAAATTGLYAFNVTTATAASGTGGNAAATTGLSIMSQQLASTALTALQNAINTVSSSRATVGAYQNRLQFASSQLQTSSQNLTTAQGGIMNTDVALQMANLTKDQILQQAGVSMLAQANAMPRALLKLFP